MQKGRLMLATVAVTALACLLHFSGWVESIGQDATLPDAPTGLKWLAGLCAVGLLAWRRNS